jgi:hypothetical protein
MKKLIFAPAMTTGAWRLLSFGDEQLLFHLAPVVSLTCTASFQLILYVVQGYCVSDPI